ncbi:MAG: hypothetical protein Q4C07_08645 [Eubacteriales bacterium]|nr:hypothetical protein [Eubacteriales bacterium]
MICQCGGRIPDNVEYCPYCGKRQFIRTRPAQLTNQPVEPFQGYYAGGGGKRMGCLATTLYTLLTLALFAAMIAFFCHLAGWSFQDVAGWLGLA